MWLILLVINERKINELIFHPHYKLYLLYKYSTDPKEHGWMNGKILKVIFYFAKKKNR